MGRPMQFDADAAVERAMRVFWRHGYGATTPQTLTAELGIGKGSLYNTFGSKHELFVRSMGRYRAWRTEFLAGNFERPAPVRQQMRDAMVVLTGYGEHDRGCLLVNASAELGSTDQAVTEIATGLFAGIEEAFRLAIERGRRDGELGGTGDAGARASALLTTVIGTSLLIKARTDERRIRRTIDATIDGL